MRPAFPVTIVLALVFSGCVAAPAEPDTSPTTKATTATTTTSDARPATTSQAVGCHYVNTATWHEPGTFARAQNASFTRVPPSGGIPVTEPRAVQEFGSLNLTWVRRLGPGVTGTLEVLHFHAAGPDYPEPFVEGFFHDNATHEHLKQEFLAFARTFLASSDQTLQSWAESFAKSSGRHGADKSLGVSGPYKADAFIAAALASGDLRSRYPAEYATWENQTWFASLYVSILEKHPVRVNQADVAEVYANNADAVRDYWMAANQTFQSYGWPTPDLSKAKLHCR